MCEFIFSIWFKAVFKLGAQDSYTEKQQNNENLVDLRNIITYKIHNICTYIEKINVFKN